MPRVNQYDFLAYADYETSATPAKTEETGETRTVAELVEHSTAAQLDYLVESGELTGEQVYEAEKSGKARKGVLAKYAPEGADEDKNPTESND